MRETQKERERRCVDSVIFFLHIFIGGSGFIHRHRTLSYTIHTQTYTDRHRRTYRLLMITIIGTK